MKIPKFLTALTGLLVCISLIRAINGAGEISLYNILLEIQEFDFNILEIQQVLEDVTQAETTINGITKGWDDSLTGIDGFATNIKNVFVLGFLKIVEFLTISLLGVFRAIKNILLLILDIFKIIVKICGFTS